MPCSDSRVSVLAGALMALMPWLAVAAETDAKQEAVRGAYLASGCVQAENCPRFDEVYATTPPLRHALALHLRHGGAAVPQWVKHKLVQRGRARDAASRDPGPAQAQMPTTASPMLPLRIDDRSYLLGDMNDPQDPRHRIVALYDTHRGSATLHYVDRDGTAALLGDTQPLLRRVMMDYLNPGSDFARSLARPDVALPVAVRGE